jgi:hypothetical protein
MRMSLACSRDILWRIIMLETDLVVTFDKPQPVFNTKDIGPSEFNFETERLNRPQAAQYLGVSREFLELDVVNKRHKIPYIKIGSKVYYLKSDLDSWLLSRKVGV